MDFIIETPRLVMRELHDQDAEFILKLLNDPGFLRFIGDRQIKNIADAENYIRTGPQKSYTQHGFGLWLVILKETGEDIGICGLLKRENLPDIEIGYAYLERYCGKGYGSEAALATSQYSANTLNIKRLTGVTDPDNYASIKILEKIGLQYEKPIQLSPDGPWLKLFGSRV